MWRGRPRRQAPRKWRRVSGLSRGKCLMPDVFRRVRPRPGANARPAQRAPKKAQSPLRRVGKGSEPRGRPATQPLTRRQRVCFVWKRNDSSFTGVRLLVIGSASCMMGAKGRISARAVTSCIGTLLGSRRKAMAACLADSPGKKCFADVAMKSKKTARATSIVKNALAWGLKVFSSCSEIFSIE